MQSIVVHNLDNHPAKPYQEFIDLQGDFKTYTEVKKLAVRIAEVGFKYDFYAWECLEETEHNKITYPSGTCFIVDAHARQRALQLLEREGYKIPPVPYTRIQADSLKEAKLEILYLNSRYGEIQSTSEFLTGLQEQLPDVAFENIVIPEFDNSLFLETQEDSLNEDTTYTKKIIAPIYEPKHEKPPLPELFDMQKSNILIEEIKNSSLPKDEKIFLIEAAKRHTVFNYQKIADYYAQSSQEVQELMEKSALVIIDFEKAVEQGYVKLSEEIAAQYLEDYSE